MESNFSQSKEELIDIAVKNILALDCNERKTSKKNSDLISREEALNCISGIFAKSTTIEEVLKLFTHRIKALPLAQAEIKVLDDKYDGLKCDLCAHDIETDFMSYCIHCRDNSNFEKTPSVDYTADDLRKALLNKHFMKSNYGTTNWLNVIRDFEVHSIMSDYKDFIKG